MRTGAHAEDGRAPGQDLLQRHRRRRRPERRRSARYPVLRRSISSATSRGSWTSSPTSTPPAARRTRASCATSGSSSASSGPTASRSGPTSSPPAITPGSSATPDGTPGSPGRSTRSKDQSYVLFGLRRELLPHVLFPVGGFPKAEIRAIAARLGLPVHDKPDSQEICFVPDDDYLSFVRDRRPDLDTPGPIVDEDGERPGRALGDRGVHHRPATGAGDRRRRAALRRPDRADHAGP